MEEEDIENPLESVPLVEEELNVAEEEWEAGSRVLRDEFAQPRRGVMAGLYVVLCPGARMPAKVRDVFGKACAVTVLVVGAVQLLQAMAMLLYYFSRLVANEDKQSGMGLTAIVALPVSAPFVTWVMHVWSTRSLDLDRPIRVELAVSGLYLGVTTGFILLFLAYSIDSGPPMYVILYLGLLFGSVFQAAVSLSFFYARA